ncbi:MAG TPA: prefoldin subunit alpha [Desulfurococcales archaeon]|nr:prefoldin subunit alpha [Desulfurococcales archaeon]
MSQSQPVVLLDERGKILLEINYWQQQAQTLENTIESLTSILTNTRLAIEELNSIKSGEVKEILLPLGDRVLVKAEIKDRTKVLLNLGLGVHRELNIDEAISKLNEYSREIEQEVRRLQTILNQINQRIAMLKEALQKIESEGKTEVKK